MKKKLIAITMSLAMAVTMIPSFAFAATDNPGTASTSAAEEAENLRTAKEAAKVEIAAYWGNSTETAASFDADSTAEIKTIRDNATVAIDAATTQEAINSVLAKAKSDINAVKTKKEKAEIAADAAKVEIADYYGIDEKFPEDFYDKTTWDEITAIKTNMQTAVDNAATVADVESALAKAKADIDKLETVAECKASVIDKINNYFPDKRATSLADYSEANQVVIEDLKKKAVAEVERLATEFQKQVDSNYTTGSIRANANRYMTEVLTTKTNPAIVGLESGLANAVDAIATVNETTTASVRAEAAKIANYWNGNKEADYDATQAVAIKKIQKDAYDKINDSAQTPTVDDINKVYNDAKAAIDAYLTTAEMDAAVDQLKKDAAAIGAVLPTNYNDKYAAIDKVFEVYNKFSATKQANFDGINPEGVAFVAARTNYDTYKKAEIAEDIKNADFAKMTAENYLDYTDKITDIRAKIDTLFAETNDFDNTFVGYENTYNNTYKKAVTDFDAAVKTFFAQKDANGKDLNAEATYKDITTAGTYKDLYDTYENFTNQQKSQVAEDAKAIYDAKYAKAYEAVAAKKNAEDSIDKLPRTERIEAKDEHKNAISEARAAYEAIADKDAKAAVSSTRVAALQDKEAAYVDAMIVAIGTVSVVNDEVVAKVEAARAAYDALKAVDTTSYGKVKPANVTALDNAEKAIKAYNDTLIQDVKNETAKAFDAVKDVTAVTDENLNDVEAAIAAYDKLVTVDAEAAKAYSEKAGALKDAVATYKKAVADAEEATKAEAAAVAALENATVKVANVTYTGKALKPAVTVTDKAGNAVAADVYKVVYTNNTKVGKAEVTIAAKSGTGYTGIAEANFTIKPAKATITSLKAGSKKFTVKVKAQSGAKYQIAYKVKGAKSYKVVATSNYTKTIKSLKKGKTYAVKVRAYAKIDGKNVYGTYSAVKTVKVK